MPTTFTPATMPTTITASVPVSIRIALEEFARERQITLSALVRELLTKAVKDHG